MSREIWVISDTHFNHENIIKYSNRPFDNVHHMNEAIITNWNSVVNPLDKVYHLGDVYFAKHWKSKGDDAVNDMPKNERVIHADYLLSRLNGRKRLLLGNHDEGKDQLLQKYFQKIMMWRLFKEFGILLTHVPVHEGTFNEKKSGEDRKFDLNIHGHLHNNVVMQIPGEGERQNSHYVGIPDKRYRNVSVERINYTPINIEELRVK